jgi:hypothetical protein
MAASLSSSSAYRTAILTMLAGALPEWRAAIVKMADDACLREEEVDPMRIIWRSTDCSAPAAARLPEGRLCIAAARDVDGKPLLVHAFFGDGRVTEVEWFKPDLSPIRSLPPASAFRAYPTLTTESFEILPP